MSAETGYDPASEALVAATFSQERARRDAFVNELRGAAEQQPESTNEPSQLESPEVQQQKAEEFQLQVNRNLVSLKKLLKGKEGAALDSVLRYSILPGIDRKPALKQALDIWQAQQEGADITVLQPKTTAEESSVQEPAQPLPAQEVSGDDASTLVD